MKSNFIKIWQILSVKERRQLVMVSGLQVLSGLVDMVGVVSILPFLSVAADPKLLQSNEMLRAIQHWSGYSDKYFLVLLGMISLGALIINQAVRLVNGWYAHYVALQIWWALHKRMFSYYMNQPYLYHLQYSSTILLEKLQVRTNAAVAGVIKPIFLLMSSFLSTLFMFGLLVWSAPVLTLSMVGIIGTFYMLVYWKIKNKLDFYGAVHPEFSRKSFNLIAEALGAIKEIKVLGNSQIYLNLFDPLAKRYCDSGVKKQLFSAIPGGMVEVLAFGGILFVTLMMMSSSGLQHAIPLLGMYALALRRMLPEFQRSYQQIAEIRFYQPSLEIVYDDMVEAMGSPEILSPIEVGTETERNTGTLELKDLSFSYPGTGKRVLDSISLEIPPGNMIGIAGSSGAGKTTLVDLILGLFEPDSGNILFGGKVIVDTTLSSWQTRIGYVPQTAFIADGTIARNIAFGAPRDQVNLKRVREVAKIVQISEFIESELPQQYETLVGERGVRLSGGQRQRLGIARALYHEPDVLVLDEATSALDGITEKKVMNSILKLSGQKTIVLIAHRLTTLRECDTIFLLEEGHLIDKGTYSSLMETNPIFRRMARQVAEEETPESQGSFGNAKIS